MNNFFSAFTKTEKLILSFLNMTVCNKASCIYGFKSDYSSMSVP